MASVPFYAVGKYACKVVEQALGESSTGKPQFLLRFTVIGQVDPADPSQLVPVPAQYQRTHYRSITEKTIQYFTEDLKALGFKGESFKELDPDTEGFHNFTGQNVDMWCSHKSGPDGALREEWNVARAVGSLEVKPLERKKVRELDNLFGKHLKGLKVAGAAAPVAAQLAPVGGLDISDDDVPF
jgi:hypothetical protein